MITYRPYRNSDPPALIRIWGTASPLRGWAQGVTVDLFDDVVLSKPYFDPAGLLVAVEDEQPVGFVHAGFGPNQELDRQDHRRGVISMLVVQPRPDQDAIAAELLQLGERFLRENTSETITAIGVDTDCPFYLGLYGGSHLPGVLDTDEARQNFFKQNGYEQVDSVKLYERDLSQFRPIVDRKQLQIRRANVVELTLDPPTQNWWEACTLGCFELVRAQLVPRKGGPPLAAASLWNMEPLVSGKQAVGLTRIDVADAQRQAGVATYLLGETLRQLAENHFFHVESQTRADDRPTQALLEKLGFTQYGAGQVLSK